MTQAFLSSFLFSIVLYHWKISFCTGRVLKHGPLFIFLFCSHGRLFKRALNQDRAVKRVNTVSQVVKFTENYMFSIRTPPLIKIQVYFAANMLPLTVVNNILYFQYAPALTFQRIPTVWQPIRALILLPTLRMKWFPMSAAIRTSPCHQPLF